MNIIVASGGTLGHLTPILPVVNKLSNIHNIYLLTSKDLEFDHSFKKIYKINAIGRTKNIVKFISVNIKASKFIKQIINNIKPDLVIGMGGYISGLVVRNGIKNKIHTIIHEQNSVLGLANKLVVKKVDLLIHSYYDINYNGINKKYLPNPRFEEASIKAKLYKKINKQILITSGTNGSKVINEISIELAKRLKEYNFLLVTGKKYYDEYKYINYPNLQIIPSTKNLIQLIAKSEIVISRAGATTISEILGTKTKAIYIPSPNVTNNHQFKNTKFIKENKLGIVLLENELTIDNLLNKINDLENNKLIYETNLNKLNEKDIVNKYIESIYEVCGIDK